MRGVFLLSIKFWIDLTNFVCPSVRLPNRLVCVVNIRTFATMDTSLKNLEKNCSKNTPIQAKQWTLSLALFFARTSTYNRYNDVNFPFDFEKNGKKSSMPTQPYRAYRKGCRGKVRTVAGSNLSALEFTSILAMVNVQLIKA